MREPEADRSAKRSRFHQRVERRRETRAGVVPVPRGGRLPLSLQQEDLWFLDQLAPGLPIYNQDFVLRLHGELDVDALARATNALAARHESLRTRFVSEHGVPRQVIDPPVRVPLPVIDLSHLEPGDRQSRERQLIGAEVRRPYDLAAGPLFRLRLLRLGPAEHALLVSAHHLVLDGGSLHPLTRDLAALYQAEQRGEPDALPPLPIQYPDFAAWQRTPATAELLRRQLEHNAERLRRLPELPLPADRPRPGRQTWAGAMAAHRLPDGLYDDLAALARGRSTTVLASLVAGLLAVLARYTGQHDLAIGTAVSGRTRPELANQVGFFVNMLVLRCDASGDPTFLELMDRASDAVMDAFSHQDAPFGRLVNLLQPERDTARNPLFQIALVLQFPFGTVEIPGLTIEQTIVWEMGVDPGTSRFDITMSAGLFQGRFEIYTEYSTELFDGGRIERLHRHLQRVLEQALRRPETRLSELDVLTPDESPDVARPHQPAPPASPPDDEGEPPGTPTELALAGIWHEIFGLSPDQVSIHDSFFAIGGSSLQAVELMTRIRESFQVELDLQDVFAESTISQLAALVDRGQTELEQRLLAEIEGLSDEEVLRLLQESGEPP